MSVTATAAAELFALASDNEAALRRTALRFAQLLRAAPERSLHERCANTLRALRDDGFRFAAVATSIAQLTAQLEGFADGKLSTNAFAGPADPRRRALWLFPGHGTENVEAGRRLLREQPVFRAAVEACDVALRRHRAWSLIGDVFARERSDELTDLGMHQLAAFAVQVGLSALWRSWGIVPDAVAGHSAGEVAAAHVAGILTLEDATTVMCERSALLAELGGKGRMAHVALAADDVEQRLVPYGGRLSIAAMNGPTATVVSGDLEPFERFAGVLANDRIPHHVLAEAAGHSAQVDPLSARLAERLAALRPNAETVPFYSTVTAAPCNGRRLGASYWAENVRHTVRFAPAVAQAFSDGYTAFVEIGAQPILLPAVEEQLREHRSAIALLPTLRRKRDPRFTMLVAAAALYAGGHTVRWERIAAAPNDFTAPGSEEALHGQG